MLVKTETIVLKSMKYRDTSKIVTFYSREYGKLKCIAKGARSAKNKYGSALEPLTHSMLVLYKKEHRDLHLISQCDAIDYFKNLTNDLDRMSVALSMIELVNQVTHDEERNPPLYSLLVEMLRALNFSTKNYEIYLQAFRLRLAALFGYAPNFDICGVCGGPILIGNNGDKHIAFQVARGAVFCSRCYEHQHTSSNLNDRQSAYMSLTIEGLKIARQLLKMHVSSLSNIEFDERIGNEMEELGSLYLRYHFDGLKPLKLKNILMQ